MTLGSPIGCWAEDLTVESRHETMPGGFELS
jgi:nitrogen fixation protein NifZ